MRATRRMSRPQVGGGTGRRRAIGFLRERARQIRELTNSNPILEFRYTCYSEPLAAPVLNRRDTGRRVHEMRLPEETSQSSRFELGHQFESGRSEIAQSLLERVTSVTARAQCAALLVDVDPRLARAVATQAPLFLVHPDAAGLQGLFGAYCVSGSSAGVLCYRGTPQQFAREIPVAPDGIVAGTPASLLAIWPEIPAGASILIVDDAPATAKWVRSGFLEGTAEPGVYRATARFSRGPLCPPRRLLAEVNGALQRLYAAGGEGSTFAATEPIRRWRLEESGRMESLQGDWPSPRAELPPLPDCLPDGSCWPLISVITPSFNQGKYIEETILSVANQGYPRVEHIVMDGGSNDSTHEVLQRHRWRLAAAVSEKDRGQSHAINKGMALATGEILTWLNSDDMLAPGALAGVAFGFWMSKADMVAGVVRLRSAGKTTGFHMTSCARGELPVEDLLDLDGGWNAGKFFYQPEVLFTRGIWERAGGKVREDLFYSMDYDLWVRMAQAKANLHVIGREVAWFRLHEEQKTNVQERFKEELSKPGEYRWDPPRPEKIRSTVCE